MKKILFVLFILTCLTSCNLDHELEVKIKNNSDARITNIRFSFANGKYAYAADGLSPKEEVSGKLEVVDVFSDENVIFEYTTANGQKIRRNFSLSEEKEASKMLIFEIANEDVNLEEQPLDL